MGCEKTFQLHLDPDLVEEFNDSLGKHEHISEQISFVEKAFERKKYRGVPAWDCICTCVHRIRDGVAYLNGQKLGSMKYRSAFDFINFINNAAVVLDCVQMLADILGVDLMRKILGRLPSIWLAPMAKVLTNSTLSFSVHSAGFIPQKRIAIEDTRARIWCPARI